MLAGDGLGCVFSVLFRPRFDLRNLFVSKRAEWGGHGVGGMENGLSSTDEYRRGRDGPYCL